VRLKSLNRWPERLELHRDQRRELTVLGRLASFADAAPMMRSIQSGEPIGRIFSDDFAFLTSGTCRGAGPACRAALSG